MMPSMFWRGLWHASARTPYDRLFSLAVRDEDPRERMAELGDAGFIQFTVDESAGLVRVYDLVWIG
jgi:hypothetical protein